MGRVRTVFLCLRGLANVIWPSIDESSIPAENSIGRHDNLDILTSDQTVIPENRFPQIQLIQRRQEPVATITISGTVQWDLTESHRQTSSSGHSSEGPWETMWQRRGPWICAGVTNDGQISCSLFYYLRCEWGCPRGGFVPLDKGCCNFWGELRGIDQCERHEKPDRTVSQ